MKTHEVREGNKIRVLFDHGLPFDKTLAKNVTKVNDRVFAKKASLILVDGGLGEGKTTLAVQIAKYLNGGKLDYKLQVALGGSDFATKMLECHKKGYHVMVYDEAGDLNKKATMTRFNRNLMRIFEMFRAYKILVIMALPMFTVLEDELFRNKIPRMLVHCYGRTAGYGRYKVYDLEQMFYIKHYAKKVIVAPKAYGFGMMSFGGQFLDLPQKESELLEKMSIDSKRTATESAMMQTHDKVSTKDIEKHFYKSRSWVDMKLKEAGWAGKGEQYGRLKYYPREVLKDIEEV